MPFREITERVVDMLKAVAENVPLTHERVVIDARLNEKSDA